MSAEALVLSNPRHNNRDYVVSFVRRDGTRKKIQTLRPGESCVMEHKSLAIEEVARPPRLLLTADGFVPDTIGSVRPKKI